LYPKVFPCNPITNWIVHYSKETCILPTILLNVNWYKFI
jgi:hypothetical protein